MRHTLQLMYSQSVSDSPPVTAAGLFHQMAAGAAERIEAEPYKLTVRARLKDSHF